MFSERRRSGGVRAPIFESRIKIGRSPRENYRSGALTPSARSLAALEERSFRSIEDRLKGYLSRRVDSQGEVAATHEQIALSLGTAREVVSRKLGQLGKAGWIKTHRGRIRLLKPKLRA